MALSRQTDPIRRARVLQAQYRFAVREPDEYARYLMNEANNAEWYALLTNIAGGDNEFVGGEYLVRVVLPEDFPKNPPEFYFLTPQGLYGIETKVCIDIGEYHKDNYRATLGAPGFIRQLVSGLIGWASIGKGIQLLKTTADEKAALAAASKAYNRKHHASLICQIEEQYESYSQLWKPKASE